MIELLDRSRLRKLALPRAFMQNMLLPYRGQPGAAYTASWGEKDGDGRPRFEVTLRSFSMASARAARTLKPRKDGAPRVTRKHTEGLNPAHADTLVGLLLVQQARVDAADLSGLSFQTLWRAMHGFRDCGNYSGAWKTKVVRALEQLARCEMTLIDRGPRSGNARYGEPLVKTGPLLRVFWNEKRGCIGKHEYVSQTIDRILWGPAIEHMLDENLTLSFRADEYFGIRAAPARVAYLFAPAPAAARARDTEATRADGRPPSDFSQSSTSILLKLGYSPEEISDRYCRHRLLLPLQAALDRRALSNGHLAVSLTRHQPPGTPRHDWRLSWRVIDRRPSHASPVEDVTFLAAQAGGRSRSELYAALRQLPTLEDSETHAIEQLWPETARLRAVAWARKVKGFLVPEDRRTFSEILNEVRMLKATGYRFRKAPAAMAVGLAHQLLRTHEWPLPQQRVQTGPP